MYKISINDKLSIEADKSGGHVEFNDIPIDADIISIRKGTFHIIHNYSSYTAEVCSYNRETNNLIVKVNGTKYSVIIRNEMDQLMQKLAMTGTQQHKALNIKAPMPGLVLDVKVTPGEKINKGDAILILEAMKMENVLKASEAGTVKKISVNKGDKVEKNQVMMVIE